jgi:hypothetical protein
MNTFHGNTYFGVRNKVEQHLEKIDYMFTSVTICFSREDHCWKGTVIV